MQTPDTAETGASGAKAEVRPMLLTTAETKARLKVGTTKLYELIAEGSLEAVKIGSSTRIVAESVDRFVASLPRLTKLAA